MEQENLNISLMLSQTAARLPHKPCLIHAQPRQADGSNPYQSISFGELEQRVQRCAAGIAGLNIGVQTRVLVMIRPGVDLVTAVLALLRVGAVPIFIDEGMGVESMLKCIVEVQAEALFGVARALDLRNYYPAEFASVRTLVVAGEGAADSAASFSQLCATPCTDFPAAPMAAEDLSLILFTTGSTGTPKGVQYTPRVVRNQLAVMRDTWGLTENDVDLSTFPTFVIGTISIGMTVVVPDMDPANPAHADPARIVQAIQDHQTTYTFGPPALWNKVTRYCVQHGITLPSMRNVLVAGAPVPATLVRRFQQILPNGACHTPIGATEANPITNISMQELIAETLPLTDRGHGVCVGRPLQGHEIRVIQSVEHEIADWSQARILGPGEIGELVVLGPVVTHHYFRREQATRKAKIYGDPLGVAHRMGDTGFKDEQGRIWFCGRRAHVVHSAGRDWYPLQVESAFNCLPGIWRTALVAVRENGEDVLALCIEFEEAAKPSGWELPAALLQSLRTKAEQSGFPLRHFLACLEGFPVDIRHNSKINRPALGLWAQDVLSAACQIQSGAAAENGVADVVS